MKNNTVNKRRRKNRIRKNRIRVIRLYLFLLLFIGCTIGIYSFVQKKINPTQHVNYTLSNKNSSNDSNNWKYVVVNKWNEIPNNYSVNLVELSNGESVDSRIYDSLQEMFDDARKDGLYPTVVSGYRTYNKQKEIMDDKVQEYIDQGYSSSKSKKLAEKVVAQPGTSEHELGIAVDINNSGDSDNTEIYEWLAENAYKYGFIMRYPEDKEDLTGISYEPWHYRYVGVDAAKTIYEKGICLEEYVEKYVK